MATAAEEFGCSQTGRDKQAERFLATLAGRREVTDLFFNFRIFPEGKDGVRRYMPRLIYSTLRGAWRELQKANQAGMAVCVTVNETKGAGGRTQDVERVRAVFVDLDDAPVEPILNAPLLPHILVETSPCRYHAYWRVLNCPLDKFRPVQFALALKFNGDRGVCDLPRVMRLPGFDHLKGRAVQSKLLVAKSNEAYEFSEVVQELRLCLINNLNRKGDRI